MWNSTRLGAAALAGLAGRREFYVDFPLHPEHGLDELDLDRGLGLEILDKNKELPGPLSNRAYLV